MRNPGGRVRACCVVALLAITCVHLPTARAGEGAGDAETGRGLYKRYCRGCHGVEGRGDGMVFMPKVPNLSKKGYIDELPDDYLVLAITKGGPGIGKSNYMPAWEGTLSDQQILDIVAYIRSLPLN